MAKPETLNIGEDYIRKYGFYDTIQPVFQTGRGLSRRVVEEISYEKGEPKWMRDFRLRAYEIFISKPMPTWGPDLSGLNFDEIVYYIKPTDRKGRSWDEVPEEIKRTFDRLGIPEWERKFLAGVGAQYDCLTADAMVYTDSGLVPIAKIQPGQWVYSLDPESRRIIKQRVRGVMYKGKLPVFEVKVAGRTLKATYNHPFYAIVYEKGEGKQRGTIRPEWRYLSDLQAGDYIAIARRVPDEGKPYRLPEINLPATYRGRNQCGEFEVNASNWLYTRQQRHLRLPTETSEPLMWFLGAYLGDGCLRRKRRDKTYTIVDIAFPATQPEMRAQLADALCEAFHYRLRPSSDPYRVRIYSAPIARFLETLGVTGNAYTKSLPDWVYSLPRSQQLALLAGYIDADGGVRCDERNNDVLLTSVNESLLKAMHRLAVRCGLNVSAIYTFTSKSTYKGQTTERTGYRFLISGDLTPLAEYSVKVRNNLAPRRYHHRYRSYNGSPLKAHTSEDIGFARIDSITYVGVEDTYDIEVEGVHNFIAEGIIVHNSEVIYHNLARQWEEKGVIFVDTDTAVREYPDLVREYFGTVIPPHDNKFAALNSAVWSGGSFVYVPAGVHVEIPLQAYFRINAKNAGQFERTLIIAEEGAFVHYVEGCLPAGEQVCTESGWVNVESIKPGDFVLDEKGRRVKVRAVMTRPYKGEMMVIRPISPHNTIRLTPEHPVLCVRREQVQTKRQARQPHWKVEVDTRLLLETQPEYVPAGELREGDFIVFPKPIASAEEVPFTAEQLRLLGYYLAEGSAYIHRTLKVPVVTFTVGEHETELIQDLTYLIEHLTGKRAQVVRQPKRHAVNITAYSHELMAFCLEHAGKGAATKRLSEAIMRLPAEVLRPLIDAYFAGDGNICWKGNSEMHRIITASETLARQIQMLLARLGIYASIEQRAGGEDTIQGRRIRRRPQYVVVWTNRRRMGEVRDAGDYFLVPIKQIERVPYDGFVFNLDVEAPHSYLVRGFATHNCTAPVYAEEALHSAVVEIIVKRGARVRYTTIQNWSRDVYNLVTKRAVVYGDAVMEWVDGNLGCVCAGELVYTERGPVPIEQVEPGTRVWSFDETRRLWVLRPVVARKDSGLQQVYEIALSNGRSLRLTANHPLLTVQYDAARPQKLGRYSLRWKPVEALQAGDLIIFPTALQAEGQPYRFARPSMPDQFTGRNQYGTEYAIASHSRQPVQLPEYADEDICWLLGLWMAEGDYTIQRGRNGHRYGRVGFSVPTTDRAYPRLISLLTRYFGNHAIELRKDERYLRVNSLEFALWLQANGFVSGAKEKRVPAWVFTLPTTMQAAFLAGYIDGDGCARGNRLSLKSANRALLQDVQQLALQCGVHASAVYSHTMEADINRTGRTKQYTAYRLDLANVAPLLPHLTPALRERLSTPKKARRHQRLRGFRTTHLLTPEMGVARIQAITPSIVAPTYDLEVAEAHSFVVNGVLVHNSRVTMKYPSVYLLEPGARGEVLSVAFAGDGQHQDTGGKAIHAAPYTSSRITSKSISKGTGRASYRGLVQVLEGAHHSKCNVECDALLLDENARTDTYPYIEVNEQQVTIGHEARVSKVSEEQLFYLRSRGLKKDEALTLIVSGFIEPLAKQLPMEYAVELNRLIELEMEGSVG
jgi:Fe-S cluster assembly scaffold protein SufB